MNTINVLLIEDDPILAMDLALRLNKLGYHVLSAVETSSKALDIYRNHPVDLTLIDIGTPEAWSGIGIAREIQAIRRSPFIFMTSQTDSLTNELAQTAIPSAYLLKPFDDLTLKLAINLSIQTSAVRQTNQLPVPADEPVPEALTKPGESLLCVNEVVFIKQNYRFVKFRLADVLYLQSEGNYTDIITTTRKYTIRLVLNKVLSKLMSPDIVRNHRCYAVNIRHIHSFSEQEVWVDTYSIPVGRSYREAFVRQFATL